MNQKTPNNVRLIIPKDALLEIFDECDKYDHDETGGRIIGEYIEEKNSLIISVTGVIESGPKAQRSPYSFFQDGEHQEKIFREIEQRQPKIEHLGNWHTHHVNGVQSLSSGDVDTYIRIVNHSNHNTDFFYAFLVTTKKCGQDPLRRYDVKHYIIYRNDEYVYEIPQRQIKIVDKSLSWPKKNGKDTSRNLKEVNSMGVNQVRVYDNDIIAEHYSKVRPYASSKLGLYWRGKIDLIDKSKVEVVVLEDSSQDQHTYSIVLKKPPKLLKSIKEQLAKMTFSSAHTALISAERILNRQIFQNQEEIRKYQSSQLKE